MSGTLFSLGHFGISAVISCNGPKWLKVVKIFSLIAIRGLVPRLDMQAQSCQTHVMLVDVGKRVYKGL